MRVCAQQTGYLPCTPGDCRHACTQQTMCHASLGYSYMRAHNIHNTRRRAQRAHLEVTSRCDGKCLITPLTSRAQSSQLCCSRLACSSMPACLRCIRYLETAMTCSCFLALPSDKIRRCLVRHCERTALGYTSREPWYDQSLPSPPCARQLD